MADNEEFVIRAGYVNRVEIGKKNGVFKGFYYDEARYAKHLDEAKKDVEEAINKYSKLGTFNLEIPMAQSRYYSLLMKLATISVGADSELNQQMIVDSVDDAVKAAASAFNNGVVQGCNTTLIAILAGIAYDKRVLGETLNYKIASIMARGFMMVQRRVLTNAFPPVTDKTFKFSEIGNKDFVDVFKNTFGTEFMTVFMPVEADKVAKHVVEIFDAIYDDIYETKVDVYDVITAFAAYNNTVFDVSTKKYTDTVVNSVETDIEVMKSVSDLISILINGNQMVIATYGGNNNQ